MREIALTAVGRPGSATLESISRVRPGLCPGRFEAAAAVV